jgi:hypothetical protein
MYRNMDGNRKLRLYKSDSYRNSIRARNRASTGATSTRTSIGARSRTSTGSGSREAASTGTEQDHGAMSIRSRSRTNWNRVSAVVRTFASPFT